MRKFLGIVSLLVLFSFSQPIRAQELDSLFNLSLSELSAIKVEVTSYVPEELESASGIVTVITKEDISNNYCRDMVDVLNMVPGINISKDEDYTTFTSRGLYGFEGRTLIMVDGMQLSDLYFGSYVIGNDFPIHMIERVEINRGPGSVLFGGTAELAVINIVTQSGNDIDGIKLSARYGQLPDTYGHYDFSLMGGKKVKDADFSLLASFGKARRSDGRAAFINYDTQFDHYEESAGLQNSNVVARLKIKDNTKFNFIFNQYRNKQVRGFDIDPNIGDSSGIGNVFRTFEEGVNQRRVEYTYTTVATNLEHKVPLGKDLSLVPMISYQYSYPFERRVANSPREEVDIHRIKGSLYGVYNPNKIEVIAGGEYFGDYASINRPWPDSPMEFLRKSISDAGTDNIYISNYSLFGNIKYILIESKNQLNLIGGVRYDYNELYGQKTNPRIGVTYSGNRFSGKVLFNSAFRAPLVGNNAFSRYGLDPDTAKYSRDPNGVSPESTIVIELEAGLKIGAHSFIRINLYQQEIRDIIEFRYNYMNRDLYSDNGGRIGTRGIEAEWQMKTSRYDGMLNVSLINPIFYYHENPWAYSYNSPRGGDTYITPDNNNGYPTRLELLSVPGYKVYTNHSYSIAKKLTAGINILYVDKRYAYNGGGTSKLVDEQVIFGAGISYKNPIPGMTIQLSIHDLFNQRLNIATAWYDGAYDVLPYKGREISLTVFYKLPIN